jgi:hypothetical protein
MSRHINFVFFNISYVFFQDTKKHLNTRIDTLSGSLDENLEAQVELKNAVPFRAPSKFFHLIPVSMMN